MSARASSSRRQQLPAPAPAPAPAVVEDERYSVAPFPSDDPSDAEVLTRLPPLLARYLSEDPKILARGVNVGLLWQDPCKIPGMMPRREDEADKTRDKYFVTDYGALKGGSAMPLATPNGFWKQRDSGCWGIRIPAGHDTNGPVRFAGLKTTYDFHAGQTMYEEGSNCTNWIMDVYSLIDHKTNVIEDDLVMCHVFETNSSQDYDPRPICAAHHHHQSSKQNLEKVSNQAVAVNGESQKSLFQGPAGLLATHISSNRPLPPTDHAPGPQLGYATQRYHEASKENVVCNQAIHGQSNNSLFERSPGHISFNNPLSPPGHAQQPRCVSRHHQVPKANGEPFHFAIHDQSNDSFNLTDRPPLSPATIEMIQNLENIMEISDHETPMDTEKYKPDEGVPSSAVLASAEKNGPRGKRTRTHKTKSIVWERFTKLFTKAMMALAVCNHCCKVLTGDSSNGTSHLNRHKCSCNCKHSDTAKGKAAAKVVPLPHDDGSNFASGSGAGGGRAKTTANANPHDWSNFASGAGAGRTKIANANAIGRAG